MTLTVKDFAKTLKISDAALIERMKTAGLSHSKNTDEITASDKQALLRSLKGGQTAPAPKPMTSGSGVTVTSKGKAPIEATAPSRYSDDIEAKRAAASGQLKEQQKIREDQLKEIAKTKLEEQKRIIDIPKDELARTYTGWDLGMSDSTSIWVAQVVNKEVRLIDFTENHGVGLDYYVNWLREHDYMYATHILPHDVAVRELGTGKSRKEMLEESGLNITIATKLSVMDGIAAARQLLPRCWFDKDKTKQGYDALRNYRRVFDEKRNVFHDRPFHDWASHASDAFRYLAVGMDESPMEAWSKPLKQNTSWIV